MRPRQVHARAVAPVHAPDLRDEADELEHIAATIRAGHLRSVAITHDMLMRYASRIDTIARHVRGVGR